MVLIAAGQISSTSSLSANGALVVKLIERAVELGVKVLFLPEASDYIAQNAEHSKTIVRTVGESPFYLQIKDKLKELHNRDYHLFVSVGIHEPSSTGDRVKNTHVWINDQGEIEQRYQKIHLFDVKLDKLAEGVKPLKESDSVEPGSTVLPPFPTVAGQLGLGVCYDLRFPEHALRLRSLGAELLAYPSAFTVRTGAAHWRLLLRARAIDTQSYVVAAAQGGHHQGTPRESYGHALIVDPWGTVIAEVSDVSPGESALALAEIDLSTVGKVRASMPLWQQRRPDVFGYEV